MPGKPPTTSSARPFVPEQASLDELRAAAPACKACELYANATQVVFGAGAPGARVMLVGEQPGDQEDLQGQPFVGPAGRLLDKAIAEAGLDRAAVYLTNAVKHFKFRREGKRRIHEKPRISEVRACHPWLEAEVATVRPAVVVCLGATAAQAVVGPSVRVTRDRGRVLESPWGPAVASVHPSAVLRADDEQRRVLFKMLVEDLALAKTTAAASRRKASKPSDEFLDRSTRNSRRRPQSG